MTRVKADLKGEFAMFFSLGQFFSLAQATMMPNHTALITMNYITLRNYSILEKQSEEKYLQLTDRMSTLDGL